MRKLILISALLLASASAQAGETRSLSLAGIPTVTTTAASTGVGFEASKPIAQVSTRLAQAATTASDAAPVAVAPPAPPAAAPVAQAAPVTTTTTAPAATATTSAATTTASTTESKPTSTKKARRESDEHKARRIAAKYGVYW